MALRDRYDFESLVNVAENLVLRELEAQLARMGAGLKGAPSANICTCQDCVLDMAAYALNNVKPSYRVSLMGSFAAGRAEDAGYAKEISRVVREAIEKVRANPSHD
ncbi:MAG: late competence development ComFB family protein [Spirochaetes bacterium]|nr:late competence development ComFB family protein [Spirochaetota bacterium]